MLTLEQKVSILMLVGFIAFALYQAGFHRALKGPKKNKYSAKPYRDPRCTQTYFNNASRRG